MREYSSWLIPGGDKRARGGTLSRGFYRQLKIFREQKKSLRGGDLYHLPCPQGGLGHSLIARADSGVTGCADTLAEHSNIPGQVAPGLLTFN